MKIIIWGNGQQLKLGHELSGGRYKQPRKRAKLSESSNIQHHPQANMLRRLVILKHHVWPKRTETPFHSFYSEHIFV